MRLLLSSVFLAIFLVMVWATWRASMQRPIWEAGGEVASSYWFQATLVDAYCGFLTFFVWVAYRERAWPARIIWFVLIALLGNLAMSAYVLFRLWRLRDGEGMESLLLPPKTSSHEPST